MYCICYNEYKKREKAAKKIQIWWRDIHNYKLNINIDFDKTISAFDLKYYPIPEEYICKHGNVLI